jgi:hypothetical protein
VSQVLSVVIVVVCLAILVIKLLKIRKKPVLIEGVDYFPADEKAVAKDKKTKTVKNDNKDIKETKSDKDFAKEKDEE